MYYIRSSEGQKFSRSEGQKITRVEGIDSKRLITRPSPRPTGLIKKILLRRWA